MTWIANYHYYYYRSWPNDEMAKIETYKNTYTHSVTMNIGI